MDWRSGKPDPTGSAFRGIGTRGRGRARGKPTSSSARGGHISASIESEQPSSPAFSTVTPQEPATPAPHLSSRNVPVPRGTQQHTRRTPSISLHHPQESNSGPTDQQAANSRTQVARGAFYASQDENARPQFRNPPAKPEPSPISNSSRSKPPRKRSHNRTKSSSKMSTQDHPTPSSPAVLAMEKEKDFPPHLASPSTPSPVSANDLRSNIDTLVERVRAMAIAGSVADRDKVKGGHNPSNDGHIDWAGDNDDTLPDLDDWVMPKVADQTEADQASAEKESAKPALAPAQEAVSSLSYNDSAQGTPNKASLAIASDMDENGRVEDAKEVKNIKANNNVSSIKEKELATGRIKTRGKHGRKKSSNVGPLHIETNALVTAADTTLRHTSISPNIRPQLVHPLPPKPQVTSLPGHGLKGRTQHQSIPTQTAVRSLEGMSQEASSSSLPTSREKHEPIENITEVKDDELSNAADSAKAARPSSTPAKNSDDVEAQGKDFTSLTTSGQMATPPVTKRSSHQPATDDTIASGRNTLPSSASHLQIASLVHLPPSYDGSPPVHTRSQMNSPESHSRRTLNREASKHMRSHSSPQTGPGTRSHTSRPVITLDAISRISRTLGIPGTTTPPRGQALGVAIND